MKHLQYLALLILTLVVVLQGCGRQLTPEKSCNFVQNSALRRVSWKDETPVRLYVHESVPEAYHQAIEDSIHQWNIAMGRDLLSIASFKSTGSLSPRRDGFSVIYWLSTWEEDRPNEQARTTVYWSGDKIYEADIRINAKNFRYSSNSLDLDFTKVDLKSLIVHELGHVLGLAHNETKGSVMNAMLSNGVSRTSIVDIDLNSLQCEY